MMTNDINVNGFTAKNFQSDTTSRPLSRGRTFHLLLQYTVYILKYFIGHKQVEIICLIFTMFYFSEIALYLLLTIIVCLFLIFDIWFPS